MWRPVEAAGYWPGGETSYMASTIWLTEPRRRIRYFVTFLRAFGLNQGLLKGKCPIEINKWRSTRVIQRFTTPSWVREQSVKVELLQRTAGANGPRPNNGRDLTRRRKQTPRVSKTNTSTATCKGLTDSSESYCRLMTLFSQWNQRLHSRYSVFASKGSSTGTHTIFNHVCCREMTDVRDVCTYWE